MQESITNLHFGQLSVHDLFARVMHQERWRGLSRLNDAHGSRRGFWGVSEGAEAFLEQLLTWRGLAFNTCAFLPGFAEYELLPPRSGATLARHAGDRRPVVYALDRREPDSFAGIFWVLGLYDRPFGRERPIFGTVRYMSSANALRKLRLRDFLPRCAD